MRNSFNKVMRKSQSEKVEEKKIMCCEIIEKMCYSLEKKNEKRGVERKDVRSY